jgi:8-oxo-dGTP pyrophosphatase MutT (NUDIX family)
MTDYARAVVGLRRRLRWLLRRIGLGRSAPSRKAVKPRAVAVVVNGDQVLVIKRHKHGRDYAVLPGGGVEEGETAAEAALRELREETTLIAEVDRLLWTGRHNDRAASYFLMTAVRGRAELSGPEALANRTDNSFELRWVTADRFTELGLHPPDIRGPLGELLAGRPA